MEKEHKIGYFEYVLKMLLSWNAEFTGSEIDNDLSTLKSLKLLFFISAVDTNEFKKSILLESVFDKFFAMPYGHVESEIYDEIKGSDGVLPHFRINNVRTEETSEFAFNGNVNAEVISAIDHGISTLKDINPALIMLSQFELVELSHAWYSWQSTYNKAKRSGQKSIMIPIDTIKSEDKIFSLKVF